MTLQQGDTVDDIGTIDALEEEFNQSDRYMAMEARLSTIIEDRLSSTFPRMDRIEIRRLEILQRTVFAPSVTLRFCAKIAAVYVGELVRDKACGVRRNRYSRDQSESGCWLIEIKDYRLTQVNGFRVSLPCCRLQGSGHVVVPDCRPRQLQRR